MKAYITPITLVVCAVAIIMQQRFQSLALMAHLSAAQAAVAAYTKDYSPLVHAIADGIQRAEDEKEAVARRVADNLEEARRQIELKKARARIPADVTDPAMRERAAQALVKIETGR